ncbi:hypothetical protein BANRA_03090 [Klebsiella pneumoniae]|nr:hypothetical protein BANRA_03090 [Klebsiella pneumoniae]
MICHKLVSFIMTIGYGQDKIQKLRVLQKLKMDAIGNVEILKHNNK